MQKLSSRMKCVELNRIQSYLVVKKISTFSSVVFINFNKKADSKAGNGRMKDQSLPFSIFSKTYIIITVITVIIHVYVCATCVWVVEEIRKGHQPRN